MTNQTKKIVCRECGNPVTSHKPDCKAGQWQAAAKQIVRARAPTTNGSSHKKISDHDEFVRIEYLPPEGATKIIKAWTTSIVYDQARRAEKEMPCLIFTDGKKLLINHGNLRLLAQIFNDDEQASLGQPILLARGKAANGKPSIVVQRAPAGTPTLDTATGEVSEPPNGEADTITGEPEAEEIPF